MSLSSLVRTPTAGRPSAISVPTRWRRRAGRFILHAAEMCAAMCLGTLALTPIYSWVMALFGVTDPYFQVPELSLLVIAFNMTAPMVAWMRFRGMCWRMNVEMSAAMLVETLLIIGAYSVGLLANERVDGMISSLLIWQHSLMMPAMLVPMLLRFDHYAAGMSHCQV